MTDPLDKEHMRGRHGKAERHLRTREEEQRLAQARKMHPPANRRRPRAEIDVDDDGGEAFEKMRRRERVLGHARSQAAFVPNSAQLSGTVVWLSRGRARVHTADGERDATLAPELAATQQTAVAVGDDVTLHERPGADPAVVAVAPRRSELVRVDPQNEHRRRVLAANVDVVVLVLSADRPRTGLIDRLQLALAGSGAKLAVCVNKCDLAHDRVELEHRLHPHRQADVPVVIVSATRGDHLAELEAIVRGRTVAFVGHSGVGKSTLLNRLDPDTERTTRAVREHDGKGRHTTTASSLTMLADSTRLIDTPGVRAFGLPDGTSDANAAFADVRAFAPDCRFRDCAHLHEPGCAVRAAVERGELDPERYRAFLRLQ